jgi:energy-coupling factor transporter transmembrane protein EcfT
MREHIPPFLLDKQSSSEPGIRRRGVSPSFLDKAISNLAGFIRISYIQWDMASREGLFQRLDARTKVLFLVFLLVIISLKKTIHSELAIAGLLFLLALLSRLDLLAFYRRPLSLGFLFGFLVALPSSLNVITKGEAFLPLLHLSKPYDLWIYHIPQTVGLTQEGLLGILMLTSRVVNSLTATFLLLHTTAFSEVIRTLKVLKLPDTMLMVLSLTYKYLFIFSRTVEDMYLARKSRLAGTVRRSEMRQWVAGRMALIFRKTQIECEEIFRAMQGRGFSGTIRVYEFRKLNSLDWIAGGILFLVGILFLLIGK